MCGDTSDIDISDEEENEERCKNPGILQTPMILSDTSSSDEEEICNPDELKNPEPEEKEKLSTRRQFWKKTEKFEGLPDTFLTVNDSAADRHNYTPQDYVSIFWDDNFLKEICKFTNMKIHQETGNVSNLNLLNMKAYLGTTFKMSCLGYPRMRMYWQKDTRVPAIANVITRNMFFQIRNHLKVLDDSEVTAEEKKKDKLWKVRPIMKRVRQGCLLLPRSKELAIDEQMIPFTGHCCVKQYVPNKPNPEGLKNFVLAAPSGLVLDFEVYQGKDSLVACVSADGLGVGGAAVMRLVETINKGTHIFIDRYFTSVPLLENLIKKEIACTGTIMKSKVPKAVHLTEDKMMSKMERGTTDMSVRQDGAISIVKWYDKKSVLICSSKLGVNPKHKCKRWSKKDRKYIEVPRPIIIRHYNENMGGIDLMDRMMSYYRIKTRTKKWTVKTILHFFDLSIVNAWILMREDVKTNVGGKFMQFLDFKLLIADKLLSQSKESDCSDDDEESIDMPPNTRKRKYDGSLQSTPPTPRSQKKVQHLPKMMDIKNSMRCKMPGCTKKTKICCMKCMKHFCINTQNNCFAKAHA